MKDKSPYTERERIGTTFLDGYRGREKSVEKGENEPKKGVNQPENRENEGKLNCF